MKFGVRIEQDKKKNKKFNRHIPHNDVDSIAVLY